jgi:hypothetical protein
MSTARIPTFFATICCPLSSFLSRFQFKDPNNDDDDEFLSDSISLPLRTSTEKVNRGKSKS